MVFFMLTVSALSQTETKPFFFNLETSETPFITKWKFQVGDNSDWAKKSFNDSLWKIITPQTFSDFDTGIQWYRAEIELNGNHNDYDLLCLFFRALASAYEVYWDGNKISVNGKVSETDSGENYAETNRLIILKQEWTSPGKHILAVRLSNHLEQTFGRIFFTQIGYHSIIKQNLNINYYTSFFSAGLFLLATLLSIALFLGGGRHRSFMLFAIFCLLNVIFPGLVFIRGYTNMSLLYLPYFNSLINMIGPLAVVFLNIFFLFKYNIPRKIAHIIINVILTFSILIVFGNQPIVFIPLYSIGLIIYAIRKNETGSLVALPGVIVYSVFVILFSYGLVFYTYHLSEVIFLFFITLSISRQIKEENRQLELTKLRSIRLESELLKKHIQPHFLMNTLLSIMSWIDDNPKKAVKLIQVLAEEFKLIFRIASSNEIPISDEIKLCDMHLELMGHRKDANYLLQCENIPAEEKVPPMIFHTLIENGLTHAFKSDEDGEFKLSCERSENRIHYKFLNNGSALQKLSLSPDQSIKEGMGIKYIKTRLEENYPGRWNMSYGLNNGYWEVNIFIEKM